MFNPYLLLIAGVIVAVMCGASYIKGANSRNPEIAKLLGSIQASVMKAQELANRDPVIEKQVVIEYRERVVKVKEIVSEIPTQVEVIRRESPDCVLPPAFRVLHDAIASGRSPSESPTGTDGAAETPCDVAAETVARNYAEANKNAEQLRSLQRWVKETSPP